MHSTLSTKFRRLITLLLYNIITLLLISCYRPTNLEQVLKKAEGNRAELEKVLEHYQAIGDEKKIEAAKFLITYMGNKYYHESDIITKYDTIFHLYKKQRDNGDYVGESFQIKNVWDSIIQKHGTIEPSKLKKIYDCQSLNAAFLIKNIDLAFSSWETSPLYNPDSFNLFCEYILPYRITNEPVENYRENYYNDLKHIIDTASTPLNIIEAYSKEFKMNRHYRVSQLLWNYPIEIPISKLEIGRRGTCLHLTTFAAFTMRACGLPVSIDRAIWANRSQGHSWNVLFLKDSIFPFDAFDKNKMKLLYKPAKIFRKRFSVDFSMIDCVSKEDIPESLINFDETDVTHEYVKTSNIKINIEYHKNNFHKKKYGIICVFDNKTWRPVHWGEIKSNKMYFNNMAVDNLYIAAYYDNGKIYTASEPFFIDIKGNTKSCKANISKLISMKLERKYPRFKRIEDHAWGLRQSKAEGANDPEFKNFTPFFRIIDIPFQVTDSLLNLNKKFRYIRLKSADHRQANYAEVEFYGKKEINAKETKLTGTIMGYPEINKENEHPYTLAMDNNLETYFSKPKGSKGWVGLDLGEGNEHIITRIRFAPRSDTNYILKGDIYELMYWNNNGWHSMGKKTAIHYNIITYDNVPSETIYLLRNLSRGKEERIFTYENNTQIWW